MLIIWYMGFRQRIFIYLLEGIGGAQPPRYVPIPFFTPLGAL
jgi:hypothetical protein